MAYDRELSFVYRNPTRIVYGEKTANDAGIEIAELGCSKAFVITDPGVVAAGLAERVVNALGARCVGTYDKCTQDSGVHIVTEAAEAAGDAGADSIVSVGGGSTIDTAKGVAILLKEGGKIEDYAGAQTLRRPQTPHVVIPTTSGTGSEVTMAIVIKDWEKHQKLIFGEYFVIPNVGILDPTIVEGLPPALTASTGMDAFTHAVEAIHALNQSPMADALALEAIRLIYENLPRCVEDGHDLLARGQQQCAATLAGIAFDNTQVGIPHALAHSVGGLYGVPHGVANSIVLPHCMRFNLEESADRYALVARAMGLGVQGMSDVEAAEAAIEAIAEFTKKLGVAQKLRDVGVPEDGLEAAADLAMGDACVVYNPVLIYESDQLVGVLKEAW